MFDRNRLTLRIHADYIDLYGERAPAFEPGSRFEYSNYGFVVLGALIEAVAGQTYYDYVRSNIFQPAGMTSTGSLSETDDVPNRSVGYMRVGDDWIPTPTPSHGGAPPPAAAGWQSSARRCRRRTVDLGGVSWIWARFVSIGLLGAHSRKSGTQRAQMA
jgi:CubicO group peptidase (beta-lactamase class C family)